MDGSKIIKEFMQMNISKIAIIAAAAASLMIVGCTPEDTGKNSVTNQIDDNTNDSSTPKSTYYSTGNKITPDIATSEDAVKVTVADGEDINLNSAGTYIISGTAKDSSIIVNASKKDEIHLVLDGLNITNQNSPCIYIKKADRAFITIAEGGCELSVTGDFVKDDKTNTDAVIFSKSDLTFSGPGELLISSTDHGITSKDGIHVTDGTIRITCKGCAFEAHDAIEIDDGIIDIAECYDGLHADKEKDETIGHIYINGGQILISAVDDAIHATTEVRIDGGEIILKGAEGIEGTVMTINDGIIDIAAKDDGINAAHKSDNMNPVYEQNGGTVTIRMPDGNTDGLDSNGDIIMNGGTLNITGPHTFDCDGRAVYNGGTIIENGSKTNSITIK